MYKEVLLRASLLFWKYIIKYTITILYIYKFFYLLQILVKNFSLIKIID